MNEQDYLMHYGVKGMKWGVRRYQNPDGTRTSLGRQHEAELKGRTSSGSRSSSSGSFKSTASKVKKALTSDTAKKVYAGVAVAAAVAGAAYLYSKNRGAVNSIVKNAASRTLSSTKSAASRGKNYINQAMNKVSRTAKNVAVKTKMSEKEFMDQKTIRSKVLNNGIKAREAVQNAAKKVDNATRSMRGAAAQKADNMAKNVSKTASKVSSAAKNAASNVRETARAAKQDYNENLRGTGKQALQRAGSVVKGAASTARSTAKSAASRAGATASKVSSAAKNAASNARGTGKQALNKAMSSAKNAASRAGTTASKAKSVATRAASNAKSGVKDFANKTRQQATQTKDTVQGFMNKAGSKVSSIGTKSIEREKAKNHGVYSTYRAAPGAGNTEELYEYMRKKGLMR